MSPSVPASPARRPTSASQAHFRSGFKGLKASARLRFKPFAEMAEEDLLAKARAIPIYSGNTKPFHTVMTGMTAGSACCFSPVLQAYIARIEDSKRGVVE